MVGGGMRQAGILAAAGLMALQENVEDLAIDQDNAKRLAHGLRDAGLDVDIAKVETNIVMAFTPEAWGSPADFHRKMTKIGVLTLPPKGNRLRFVTHRDLSNSDVVLGMERISKLSGSLERVRENV